MARKRKKQRWNNYINNHSDNNKTEKFRRREPLAVMENIKYHSTIPSVKQTIENTFPGKQYKVVAQPPKWEGNFTYLGQIGQCLATDRIYGAKLKFSEGEIIYFPFESLELVPTEDKKFKSATAESFVDSSNFSNQNVVKGRYYEVVAKPPGWKTNCRFLNRIGKCIRIDDRGARLAFAGGDEVSFPADCIKEVKTSAIDLNKENTDDINEDNVNVGDLFRVIKKPAKLPDEIGNNLIGKIGKARWANYHVVCLKFVDGAGFNVEFDALERYKPIELPNPIIVPNKLNASNIVIGRLYKLVKLPPDWEGMAHLLNKMGEVKWASDSAKGAMMQFQDGPNEVKKLIPFDCISDLPRPTETELIELIKKKPERILKIIKELRKVTKLKPVIDFIDGAVLPDVKPKSNTPTCMSDSCVSATIGETTEEMQNKVLALIDPIQTTIGEINPCGNPS